MPLDLQAIKEQYDNMNWEDFRENAGDLITREIDIYNDVVIEGVPALIAEVERLREENKTLTKSLLNDTHDEFVAQREIKRLREALEDIATRDYTFHEMLNIADKALEGDSE